MERGKRCEICQAVITKYHWLTLKVPGDKRRWYCHSCGQRAAVAIAK